MSSSGPASLLEGHQDPLRADNLGTGKNHHVPARGLAQDLLEAELRRIHLIRLERGVALERIVPAPVQQGQRCLDVQPTDDQERRQEGFPHRTGNHRLPHPVVQNPEAVDRRLVISMSSSSGTVVAGARWPVSPVTPSIAVAGTLRA